MVHARFEFDMPAAADIVFDAFHYHCWRQRWDSLVSQTCVVGGAPCPYVGAVTDNTGGGWLKSLSMQTRFVSFDRPRVAAAAMIGAAFPFSRWAASMQHRPIDARHSILIYTYTFCAGPSGLQWLIEPIVKMLFDWQTQRRFRRMRAFLASHADEVLTWQHAQEQHQA